MSTELNIKPLSEHLDRRLIPVSRVAIGVYHQLLGVHHHNAIATFGTATLPIHIEGDHHG